MPQSDPLTCTIPGLRLASLNVRESWKARAARVKREREQVGWNLIAAMGMRCKLPPPWCVTITRVGPRTLDDDNLAGSAKAVRDRVATWLDCDDGDQKRVQWRYAQSRGDYAVRIEIGHIPW